MQFTAPYALLANGNKPSLHLHADHLARLASIGVE